MCALVQRVPGRDDEPMYLPRDRGGRARSVLSWAVRAAIAVLVLALAGVLGVVWYFSGVAVAVGSHHSDGPSRALARARPDLITDLVIQGAEHTRGWNVEPQRYQAALGSWLSGLVG